MVSSEGEDGGQRWEREERRQEREGGVFESLDSAIKWLLQHDDMAGLLQELVPTSVDSSPL